MYSLLSHNTFGIAASAASFYEYSSIEELLSFISEGKLRKPFLHIGSGSNLLFVNDYEGTILHSCIKGVKVLQEDAQAVTVKAGAGEYWDDFVALCVEKQWFGAENLSLIPGEVGASAVQNIGAYGVEVKDLIVSVDTINANGEQRTYSQKECAYTYRNSIFKQPASKSVFITHVTFRLSKEPHYSLDYGTIRQELAKFPDITLHNVRKAIIDIRKSKLPDPQVLGNAGSFFMNPVLGEEQFQELQSLYPAVPHYKLENGKVKVPAAWLIEQCGWKGKALGRAAVYDKQALILVNLGGAAGSEILALSETIQTSVKQKFGIEIHPEVNIV